MTKATVVPVSVYCGDCLDVLATLEDNSIDACVTDPPYHLTSIVKRFGGENAAPAKFGKDGAYARASAGFMNKKWDGGDIAFRPEVWAQVLRVLKPGAHLLSFGGTRTYHRMACAVEDVGFEIRDCVQWIYGSGFPKSLNVSKAIDKAARGFPQGGADPTSANHGKFKSGCSEDNPAGRGFGAGPGQFMKRGEGDRETLNAMGDGLKNRCVKCGKPFFSGSPCACPKPRPITDEAQEWSGWGTALKPACELIVLARKPLSEATIVANVLRWGTGAINVDGCKVATDEQSTRAGGRRPSTHEGYQRPGATMYQDKTDWSLSSNGRWPANVIHDGSEEVVGAFPDTTSAGHIPRSGGTKAIWSNGCEIESDVGSNNAFADSGSAARFFYTAKADADDRLGSKHPTIKPVDLMQYLVRLVTPPKGLVLDPFAGSGPTGEACIREGMRAILIEREAEYQEDIRRRLRLAMSGPDERAREGVKARNKDKPVDAGPLFKDVT